MDITPISIENNNKAHIKVIGVGGGGNNAVNHMFTQDIKDVELVVCNTDLQVLMKSEVKTKLQIGAVITKGLGTGCDPEKGKKAAEESAEEIKTCLSDGTELLFITAGMGGGTGTGASPVIAKIAHDMGILTIAVVTLPFRDEKSEFMRRAIAGIHELKKYIDSLLIIDNQKIYEMYEELSLLDAFPKVNEVLSTAVKGISSIITSDGYINVDLNDVKMAMKNSGMALMGIGTGEGEDRAIQAAENALSSPLLCECDLSTAKSVLINIVMSKSDPLGTDEMKKAIDYINNYTKSARNFKRGIVVDESMEKKVSITLVATGFRIDNLPTIEETIMNPDEIVTIDEDDDRRDYADTISDRTQESFNNLGFSERYKNRPEKPSLIIESGDNITALENVPAYKRFNIDIYTLKENPSTDQQ